MKFLDVWTTAFCGISAVAAHAEVCGPKMGDPVCYILYEGRQSLEELGVDVVSVEGPGGSVGAENGRPITYLVFFYNVEAGQYVKFTELLTEKPLEMAQFKEITAKTVAGLSCSYHRGIVLFPGRQLEFIAAGGTIQYIVYLQSIRDESTQGSTRYTELITLTVDSCAAR